MQWQIMNYTSKKIYKRLSWQINFSHLPFITSANGNLQKLHYYCYEVSDKKGIFIK